MENVAVIYEGYQSQEATRLFAVTKSPTPVAIAIPDTPEDLFDRKRTERFVRTLQGVGKAALHGSTENPEAPERSQSLYPTLWHAIRAAAAGDALARKFVENNMRTESLEIAFKSGNINEITIEADEQDNLLQYGQYMEDVFANALRYASGSPAIYSRSLAEVRNGMRMQSAYRRGLLKEHMFVVLSRYTDSLSDTAASDNGFFVDTKSCSIQVITEDGKGALVQQSAFVAGVKTRDAERHDATAIAILGHQLGVDLSGKSDVETIDTPLLVPKSMLPGGVLDLVQMYDEAAGGTFFGEAKPAQDYNAYLAFCRRREASMEQKVQQAVTELLAASDTITDPEMATEVLHKIAERLMIDQSMTDRTINPRVFGEVASDHVMRMRMLYDQGDFEAAAAAREDAYRTAKSTSCPSAKRDKSANASEDDTSSGAAGAEQANAIVTERCVITTENCYCCIYNNDGSKRGGRLTVKAYIDSRKTIHCMRQGCGAWLAKDGKSKFIGHIAQRAEERNRQAKPLQVAA